MTDHQNNKEPALLNPESSFDTADYAPEIIECYRQLVEQEAAPADPTEIINPGIITPNSPEATILEQSGIFETDNLSRAQLLNAGFAFINTIGGGEKPLIATKITLEDGTVVDTSNRKLLTNAELSAIKEQQADPAATEQTRIAMIDFLEASKAILGITTEIKKHLFKEAQSLILAQGNTEDITAIGKLFTSITESGQNYRLAYIIEACATSLPLTKLGTVPISNYSTRIGALRGAPSPFLDSGYHFKNNDDVTLFPDDPTKTRRLNSVVVHLLSRGLNEAGASTNGSHDQTYITASEFTELMKGLGENDPELYSPETLETFAARLVAQAKNNEIES